MEKTIEKGLNMVRILEEVTLEMHKIIERKPLEEDLEETTGIVILIGIEASQEIGNIQVILGRRIEVVLGEDQVLKQVPIETELDFSSVRNMIILVRIV